MVQWSQQLVFDMMVMMFIPKSSTLGQLCRARMPTIILPCTFPLYGGSWYRHGGLFFVMIRMSLGTRPDSARWMQNRTKGKYFFFMQMGCVFNQLELSLKMRLSMFLGPGTTLGDNFVYFVYVFIEECFQNSYSGFIFIFS